MISCTGPKCSWDVDIVCIQKVLISPFIPLISLYKVPSAMYTGVHLAALYGKAFSSIFSIFYHILFLLWYTLLAFCSFIEDSPMYLIHVFFLWQSVLCFATWWRKICSSCLLYIWYRFSCFYDTFVVYFVAW